MRLLKSSVLLTLLLCVGCQPTREQVSDISIQDPFDMVAYVQTLQDPFSLYEQAFTDFTFQSDATLQQLNANAEVFAQSTSEVCHDH